MATTSIPRWGLALAGVAVLALALVIALLTTSDPQQEASAEALAGPVTIDGEPLPPAPSDPASDPALGDTAPVVTGEDFDGEPITVGDSGQPELLVFLASWCPHCQDELPELVEFVESGGVPDGSRLTAVVTGLDDSADNWPPDAWLEDEGWTGPTVVDDVDSSVAEVYGQPGTPYWVAIDADGRIAARVSGRLPMSAVSEVLQDLTAGG